MTGQDLVRNLHAPAILDTIREPLLLLGMDLRVVTANAAFVHAFGNRPGHIEGRELAELSEGDWHLPSLGGLLAAIVSTGAELRDVEIEARPGTPGHRTLLLSARRLADRDADAQLILLTFEDVTDRRRLEQALRAAMAELERSNQELEGFASIASHDLQEPLRKILAFGERLGAVCEGQLSDKARDYLARMTGAAARMQVLIGNLLSLSRVSMKREPWLPVDLNAIVAAVLVDLDDALSRTGGRVDADPLPTIAADPTQMRQLFQNLISNALKFRGEDPPVVRITASECGAGPTVRAGAASKAAWQIVIADNGIGFEAKFAERIFKPFERLHGRDAYEGTGIGLALCRRIVQRHGGAITADATVGGGARFVIHLPSVEREHA